MPTDPFSEVFDDYDPPQTSQASVHAVYRSMTPSLRRADKIHRRRIAAGWMLAAVLVGGGPLAVGYFNDPAPSTVDIADDTRPTLPTQESADHDDEAGTTVTETPGDSEPQPSQDPAGGSPETDGLSGPQETDEQQPGVSNPNEDETGSDRGSDDNENDNPADDDSDADPDDTDTDSDSDSDSEDVEDDEDGEDGEDEEDDPQPGSRLPVTTAAGSVTAVALPDGTIGLVDVLPAAGYASDVELEGDEAKVTFSHPVEDDIEIEFEVENGELVVEIEAD